MPLAGCIDDAMRATDFADWHDLAQLRRLDRPLIRCILCEVKVYVHIQDGDDPRTIRAEVTGQIVTLDETLHETIPPVLFLLEALPPDSPFLTLEPPQRRQRTLDALKRVLLRESQVQPLILVFEDPHWIDAETQALLDSLVASV
jgi:hypothetical protein